jgi:DNA ligase (NAD+)
MNNLEKRIQLLADAYYQGQELVPDSEYDALVDLLKKTKPDSELLKKEVIGSDLKGINKKYKLPYTMGTLEKCNTIEEFEKWFEKNFIDKFVIESKVDGAGVLLQYIDGELVFAYSRGDSEYGEDLTKNIKLVNGVQENISKDFSGCIRGEVVVYNDIFEEHFKGEANPRNTAAGKLKQKDGSGCDKLNFIAYDVFSDKDSNIDSTERNKISFLKNNNFETPFYKETNSLKEIVDLRNNINELRKNLRYNIDGIVIKQFNVDKEDLKRKTPLKNCAFKPSPSIKITKVKDIIWQLAGSYFAPVAIIEPVELCGTTVERASLANINIMIKLDIRVGDSVKIIRSGEIIPKIIEKL